MHPKLNRTSDKFLEQDIRQTVARYPGLSHRVSAQGHHLLEGTFPINDPDGLLVDAVDLRIIYSKAFPFSYPGVCETAGRFPRLPEEMHLNGDGTLCLNSPQQERIDCYTGIDTLLFLEDILVPNLAWRLCVLDGITFDRREFGHRMEGIIQSYQELLQLKKITDIYDFIRMFLNGGLPERNQGCFCSSGRKYKVCHGLLESTLNKIGLDMLSGHLPMIKQLMK